MRDVLFEGSEPQISTDFHRCSSNSCVKSCVNLWFTLLMSLWATTAQAQRLVPMHVLAFADTGGVRFEVRSPDGAALSGATVTAKITSTAGHSVLWQVNNWGRDDPVPVVSGIDARLIEAEAKLRAGDIAGMMTILNALRASPQLLGIYQVPAMAPLATPADQASATDLFFREKALWQFGRGFRMDDLRRLVRQYGRSQDQVFPTGNFTRNGTPSGQFGTQVAFPVPDYERTNPNFHGCIDTKA